MTQRLLDDVKWVILLGLAAGVTQCAQYTLPSVPKLLTLITSSYRIFFFAIFQLVGTEAQGEEAEEGEEEAQEAQEEVQVEAGIDAGTQFRKFYTEPGKQPFLPFPLIDPLCIFCSLV